MTIPHYAKTISPFGGVCLYAYIIDYKWEFIYMYICHIYTNISHKMCIYMQDNNSNDNYS